MNLLDPASQLTGELHHHFRECAAILCTSHHDIGKFHRHTQIRNVRLERCVIGVDEQAINQSTIVLRYRGGGTDDAKFVHDLGGGSLQRVTQHDW